MTVPLLFFLLQLTFSYTGVIFIHGLQVDFFSCNIFSRTFSDFVNFSTFPGKPGKPGKLQIYFPGLEMSWNFTKSGNFSEKILPEKKLT